MLATNCKVPHWLHYNTPYKTLISSALHYPAKPGQMFPKYESWDPMLWYCPLLETDLSSFVNLDEHFKAGQQSNSEVTYLHMVININIFCLLCLAMKVICGASLPVKDDILIMPLRTRHSHRQGQTRDNQGQNRKKQGQNRDIMDKSGTVHAGPCFVHDCHSFVHTCPWFVPACTSFILDFLFLSLFVLFWQCSHDPNPSSLGADWCYLFLRHPLVYLILVGFLNGEKLAEPVWLYVFKIAFQLSALSYLRPNGPP